MYRDIPDPPWIGDDDYDREEEYTKYDYDYDHQDDMRDLEWELDRYYNSEEDND